MPGPRIEPHISCLPGRHANHYIIPTLLTQYADLRHSMPIWPFINLTIVFHSSTFFTAQPTLSYIYIYIYKLQQMKRDPWVIWSQKLLKIASTFTQFDQTLGCLSISNDSVRRQQRQWSDWLSGPSLSLEILIFTCCGSFNYIRHTWAIDTSEHPPQTSSVGSYTSPPAACSSHLASPP